MIAQAPPTAIRYALGGLLVFGALNALAATLMMGAFSKQSGNASSTPAALGGSGGGIGAMLTPFLDRNRDGSIIDDVTSMIGGLMKRS